MRAHGRGGRRALPSLADRPARPCASCRCPLWHPLIVCGRRGGSADPRLPGAAAGDQSALPPMGVARRHCAVTACATFRSRASRGCIKNVPISTYLLPLPPVPARRGRLSAGRRPLPRTIDVRAATAAAGECRPGGNGRCCPNRSLRASACRAVTAAVDDCRRRRLSAEQRDRRRRRLSAEQRPPPRTIVGRAATAAAGDCRPGGDRRRRRFSSRWRPSPRASFGLSRVRRLSLLIIQARMCSLWFRVGRAGVRVGPLVELLAPGVSRRGLQAETKKKEDLVRQSMIWFASPLAAAGREQAWQAWECAKAPREWGLVATFSARVCSESRRRNPGGCREAHNSSRKQKVYHCKFQLFLAASTQYLIFSCSPL